MDIFNILHMLTRITGTPIAAGMRNLLSFNFLHVWRVNRKIVIHNIVTINGAILSYVKKYFIDLSTHLSVIEFGNGVSPLFRNVKWEMEMGSVSFLKNIKT